MARGRTVVFADIHNDANPALRPRATDPRNSFRLTDADNILDYLAQIEEERRAKKGIA